MARKVTVELTEGQLALVLDCIGQMTSGNAYDAGEYRKCTGGSAWEFRRLCEAEGVLREAAEGAKRLRLGREKAREAA